MSNGKRQCILMVDDDADFRDSMRRLLWTVNEALPLMVAEAPDGGHALESLREGGVDCVLLDNRMPGGSGVDWISRFLEVDPYLAIVMVTGQGDESTAVKAMKQGAMDYLVKGNISAEEIQRAIVNAMEKTTMRRGLDEQRQSLLMAERQRGMIESLGAACHHLGQPMSVLTMCLDIMQRQKWSPDVQELIGKCDEAVESVNDVLRRLQQVSEYRTVPYLPVDAGDDGEVEGRSDERILVI